jgi:hypothetical protein
MMVIVVPIPACHGKKLKRPRGEHIVSCWFSSMESCIEGRSEHWRTARPAIEPLADLAVITHDQPATGKFYRSSQADLFNRETFGC